MTGFTIVVDTQADFMAADGALAVAGAEALAEPMRAYLCGLSPAECAGVLFTFDTHFADTYPHSEEARLFPLHCVRDTPGWRNLLDIDAVPAAIPVWRMEKGVFAMWEEPGLMLEDARDPAAPPIDRDAFFDRLRAIGIDTVTVIGVAADYCVRYAIDGLVERGFRVVVPAALTRGIAMQIDAVAADYRGAVTLA